MFHKCSWQPIVDIINLAASCCANNPVFVCTVHVFSEVSVAMQSKVGLGSLAGVIHPYPTRAESIRQAGDLYNKTKLTPVVRSLFRNLMAIKR